MAPFDPLSVPLEGTFLIEASAGTGKTFAIASLFLRLVAAAGVPVETILVVTFTQSATAELRDRIRRRLVSALTDLRRGSTTDPLVAGILADPQAPAAAAARIAAALADFDRAPILTIHGFCNRILKDHAFTTGMAFTAELVADLTPYRLTVADDFWRRHIMPLPPAAARFVQNTICAPEILLGVDRRILGPTVTILAPPPAPLPTADLTRITSAHQGMREDWQRNRREIIAALEDPALNATVFGSLKAPAAAGEPTQRQIRLADRAAAIDAHLDLSIPDLSIPKALSQLAAETIAHYTRKGQVAPFHPFFDRCADYRRLVEALNASMTAFVADLRYRFSRHLAEALDRLKARDQVIGYDDLLLKVHHALTAEGKGDGGLAGSIRGQYRCALVDEFQDTDGLQYRIFSRLFGDPARLLFMIGDPKQAIYGFRGADIFSYLEASRNAREVFTLGKNWRSSRPLVQAVNALFSGQVSAFAMEGLSFVAVEGRDPGPGDAPDMDPAMVVWQVPPADKDQFDQRLTVADAQEMAAGAVTAEILRLTRETEGRTPSAAISPSQMAVLVRTNAQARLIRRHLVARGIPCVVESSDSVFATPEAADLWQVMFCLSRPPSAALLRGALLTPLMGADLADLGLPEDGDARLSGYREMAGRLGQLWTARGFMGMFSELLALCDTRRRFLARADGPRRMTNLRHLAELIHGADRGGLRPQETVSWLAARMAGDDPEDEAAQLRLETDDGAVTIVTIHKSKGLEYPVVFCPFLWREPLRVADPVYFHDPSEGFRETVDFGSPRQEAGRRQALAEAFAENLRLIYVALTRARHRCYLLWDRRLPADGSALSYLIHGCSPRPEIPAPDGVCWPRGSFSILDDETFARDMAGLQSRSGGAIGLAPAPQPGPGQRCRLPAAPAAALNARVFTGPLAEGGRVVSYSALTAGSAPGDHFEGQDHDGAAGPGPGPPSAAEKSDMSAFPRGAVAGSLFHEIMETIDFQNPGAPESRQTVARLLGDYGFDAGWRDTLCRCVTDVLTTPLPLAGGSTPLSAISPDDRICEMAFTFALKRLAPADLQAVFARAGDPAAVSWTDRLRFSPVKGHMKGYIDLWFRSGGRFYVLDWKTNHLGPSPADYGKDQLAAAMLEGDYHLQYHLYVLALHRYLKRRLAGYRYETHFGGALYLFVRGMDRNGPTGTGIFAHRPDAAVIDRLEARLIDRERMICDEP